MGNAASCFNPMKTLTCIIVFLVRKVDQMAQKTVWLFIHTVTTSTTNDMATKCSRLEPDEPRGSCPVLRGLGRSNAPQLPGWAVLRLDDATAHT